MPSTLGKADRNEYVSGTRKLIAGYPETVSSTQLTNKTTELLQHALFEDDGDDEFTLVLVRLARKCHWVVKHPAHSSHVLSDD